MSEASVTGDGGASRKELVTAAKGLSYMPEMHGYPSPAEVLASVQLVSSVADSAWKLTVTPGSIALRASTITTTTEPRSTTSTARPRRQITEFSSKSELRMLRRLVSLDYSPCLEQMRCGRMLAMVTLTYPGDWESLAPSAKSAAAHLRAFRSRLERAIGPVAAVRKTEFQRRSAPHVHLMLPLPATITGQPTPQWISTAWFEVVGSNDERHLLAGTGVDGRLERGQSTRFAQPDTSPGTQAKGRRRIST